MRNAYIQYSGNLIVLLSHQGAVGPKHPPDVGVNRQFLPRYRGA